jgi:hypothetical protein
MFPEVHAGEGVCLALCGNDAECPLDAPYCNFIQEYQVGICSPLVLGPGAICTAGPLEDPRVAGYMSLCFDSPNLACAAVPVLLPEGRGFCVAPCDDSRPCTRAEPNIGPYSCSPLTPPNSTDGICTIACSNHPENCLGEGRSGQGYACFDQITTGSPEDILPFCIERLTPPIAPSLLTSDGTGVFLNGGACNTSDASALACAEPTFCAFDGPGVGLCLIGCNPSHTDPCRWVSPTAICTPEGVCGDG